MVNIPNFRVWYEEKLWLLAKLDLWGDPDQTTCDLAPYLPKYSEKFNIPLAEVKLMQSTGLKDKNGVEIFESDIVMYQDFEYSYIGIVRKDCYQFYIEGIEPVDNFSFDDVADTNKHTANLVVIGNVWENSELLEVKQ